MKKYNKAIGGGIGGGIGAALAVLINEFFPMSSEAVSALGMVLSALAGLAGAYVAPRNQED